MSDILERIVSSILGCPVGVNSDGCQPNSCRYFPICFLEPGFNSSTLTRTTLPSFSKVSSSVSLNLRPLPKIVWPVFKRVPLSLYLGKISMTFFLAVKSFCISFFSSSSSTSSLTSKVAACFKLKRKPCSI